MTFLVCGEALYDVFVERETETGFALDARIGGSAFNAAVGMARLGLPSALLTGVSDDPLGARLEAGLAASGASTAWLRRKALRTTLALVALGPDGGARYSFYGDDAADRAVTEADLPALDGVSALLFGCIAIVAEPTGSSFLTLAARAAAAGEGRPLVTLDPNIRATVEPDMARWRDRVDAFSAHADLIKISDEDLAAIAPDATMREAAARWLAQGVSLVVVTQGGDGATAFGAFGDVSVPAPRTRVVDTVGAGDSFLAGLVASLHEQGCAAPAALAALGEAEARAAIAFAADVAARTCARRGADPPLRAELR